MKWSRDSPQSSVRLAWLLVGSFVLTIASFVAATALSEYRARGIAVAAESITTNALPSISCLSRARTELRQVERFLERIALYGDEPNRRDLSRLSESREALAEDWQTCLSVPKYPGETTLQRETARRMIELDRSVEAVLARVRRRDRAGAIGELTSRTEPLIDAIDGTMVAQIDLNARQSTQLASEITAMRESARTWRGILIGASIVLASSAALVMMRFLRRFVALMEARLFDLEQFASRVAHDIRNPLASVALALDLMKRAPDRSARMGALDRASQSLKRVVQLVDGLLVFARAGARPKEGAQANASEIVAGVVEQMRPFAKDRGVELSVERLDPNLAVAASAGVLISIVSNLLGNAIKYMGNAPVRRVCVRAHAEGDVARFEISDTGPGIDPAILPRIFDPYVRGAGASGDGIGLGLAIVRRLVEAHGGSVGCEAHEGPGSTFWFELPRIAPATAEHRERGSRRRGSGRLSAALDELQNKKETPSDDVG